MKVAKFLFGLGLTCAIISATPALAKLSKAERAALAMSPEDIADKTSITGTGGLDPALWISTQPFLRSSAGDKFFRAHIDKATGEVTYQLYIVMRTTRDAFRPSSITFMGANGLEKIPLDRVNFDVSCQRWGCVYMEDAIAEFTRAQLEYAAREAQAGMDRPWIFKVFGDYAEGVNSEMFSTEIAGFLIAVDRAIAGMAVKD